MPGAMRRARLGLEQMRHAGARWIEQAQPVEHHSVARRAGGHTPPCRGWRRRLSNHLREAECFQQAGDQTQVLSDWRAVQWRLYWNVRTVRESHSPLLGTGDGRDTPTLLK